MRRKSLAEGKLNQAETTRLDCYSAPNGLRDGRGGCFTVRFSLSKRGGSTRCVPILFQPKGIYLSLLLLGGCFSSQSSEGTTGQANHRSFSYPVSIFFSHKQNSKWITLQLIEFTLKLMSSISTSVNSWNLILFNPKTASFYRWNWWGFGVDRVVDMSEPSDFLLLDGQCRFARRSLFFSCFHLWERREKPFSSSPLLWFFF